MDKENPPFLANVKQPGLGVVIILLLVGAVVGFQLGRWSNVYDMKISLSPTPIDHVEPSPFFITSLPTPGVTGQQQNGCVTAGCSGELCVSSDQGDMVSTCEIREEYSCLQYSVCEQQKNGACGWTQTPEYSECLTNLKK